MCRTIETSCRSRTDAVVRAALLAVLLATQCWHGSLIFGQERSRQGNSVRFVVPIASPTTDLRGHSVVSDDDVKDAEASVVLSDDENVRLVGAAEELISLDKLEALDEVRELNGKPPGHPGPANYVPCVPDCCCGRREFWVVNTRCAPTCKGLDQGLDKITYWKEEGKDNFVQHTLEEFLIGADKTLPTTFWVHGNTLDNDGALVGARRVYDHVGRGVCSFRLVMWSWPAEHIKHVSPHDNIMIKWERSEAQGYYLAWLVDQLDPRVPITVSGHSFGARTVTSALQALATNYIAGYHLPERHFVGWRPMQASLIAAGMDNNLLLPGYRHGLAITQVDRLFITVNPDDRTLKVLSRFSPTCAPCLGSTGIPNITAMGDQLPKIVQVYPNTWVGKAHRFSKYARSPETAAMMRPYIFYWQSAPLEDIASPPPTR